MKPMKKWAVEVITTGCLLLILMLAFPLAGCANSPETNPSPEEYSEYQGYSEPPREPEIFSKPPLPAPEILLVGQRDMNPPPAEKTPTELTSAEHESPNIGTIVLKDPTFQELKDFILADNTSRKKMVLNVYECRHFAAEVNNNAEAVGLRCAYVVLCYNTFQHAIVAFNTVDRGLIYIEPQTDASVCPEVGSAYEGDREGHIIKEIIIAW